MTRPQPSRIPILLLAATAAALACGIESREARQRAAAEAAGQEQTAGEWADPGAFAWPRSPDGTRPVAVLQMEGEEIGRGEIHIALYPELAPKTVEAFRLLVERGFYERTTFHRVIPGFMIQGGDPNSRDDDPDNDGQGGPEFRLPDEFSAAPHLRGVVSMANKGLRHSGGSQFFVVLQPQQHLDGKYSVFGRVVRGMDVVDAISAAELDTLGRWGPQNRPLHDVTIARIEIRSEDEERVLAERAREASGMLEAAGVGRPEPPDGGLSPAHGG